MRGKYCRYGKYVGKYLYLAVQNFIGTLNIKPAHAQRWTHSQLTSLIIYYQA